MVDPYFSMKYNKMTEQRENFENNFLYQDNLNPAMQHSSNILPPNPETNGRPVRKRKKVDKLEKLNAFTIPCLRKGRQDLPLGEKIKILELLEKDPKTPQRVIASTFRVSQSQISRIQKNREKLKKAWRNGNVNRKRNRKGKGGLIELKLLEWYNEAKGNGLPLSGPTLMERARGIAHELHLDFTPTSGWFGRWKNRNGVTLKGVKDDASTECSKISIHWRRYTFTKVLREYELEDIWFLDSMALVSQLLPEDLNSSEMEISGKGKMLSLFAFNYFGSERRCPLIFGEEPSPLNASALNYCSYQEVSLSTRFAKWLFSWGKELQSKGKKIGLFLRRASFVPESFKLSSINLHFFPDGEANNLRLEPFHFGICSTFKALFRYQVATHHFALSARKTQSIGEFPSIKDSDSGCPSLERSPTPDLLDRVFMIRRAWKHVHPDVFVKGVVKAGLSKRVQTLSIDADVDPPLGMTKDEFEKFVHVDDSFDMIRDLGFVSDVINEAFPHHSPNNEVAITDAEALLACNVLRRYLQRSEKFALSDALASIESQVCRQLLITQNPSINCSTLDPLFDPLSIHSMEGHATLIRRETFKSADSSEPKPSKENQTSEALTHTTTTSLSNTNTLETVQYPDNYQTQEGGLPHSLPTHNILHEPIKATHCAHVAALSQGTQSGQSVGQYQTASYIPQNLELKSIAIGVPRTISGVGIDRFSIHSDVQNGAPVTDINPQLIPTTQLANQAPTFITFASHF